MDLWWCSAGHWDVAESFPPSRVRKNSGYCHPHLAEWKRGYMRRKKRQAAKRLTAAGRKM
jgi:hypothetical protein